MGTKSVLVVLKTVISQVPTSSRTPNSPEMVGTATLMINPSREMRNATKAMASKVKESWMRILHICIADGLLTSEKHIDKYSFSHIVIFFSSFMQQSLCQKIIYHCLLLGTFFSLSADAQIRPDPDHFGFEVTALYMKPVFDFPNYALTTTELNDTVLHGTRHGNELDFHGGFALAGIYVFYNSYFDLRVKWSHLQLTSIDEVASDDFLQGARFTLVAFPFAFRSALSEVRVTYDAIELLFGYIPIYPCQFFSLHAGVQCTQIKYDDHDTFFREEGQAQALGRWKLKMEGVGPEIGLLMKYLLPAHHLLPKIYIDGKLQCGALISKIFSHTTFADAQNQLLRSSTFNIINEPVYRLVPFWDAALGISTQCCFHSFLLEFEIGYNFIYYQKALDGVTYLNGPIAGPSGAFGPSSSTIDIFSDLVLHGLYFSAGVTY